MKALLLLALAAVGQCALLGSRKCTYGPSYWCSHIRHAKECGAMQHCLTTVWKNQLQEQAETCSDAVRVLDVVRKASEEQLLEQMAVGCTGMPADKRPVCKDLLSQDHEEVYQLLTSDLPSVQVAGVLGLCGGFPDTVSHPAQVGDEMCDDCIKLVDAFKALANASEARVVTMFKAQVCGQLGSLEDVCNQLVDQYAGVVLQLIQNELNAQTVCKEFQLCSSVSRADLVKSMKNILTQGQTSSAGCDVCQNLAKDVQSLLRDADVQTAILNFLKNDVCSIASSLASECQAYVDQYGPLVFQVLVAELDPQTICQTLGLCNATSAGASKMPAVPLGSPAGAVHIISPELSSEASSTGCALCEFVMTKLEGLLSKNATEQEIENALDKVCALLPSTLTSECDQFVAQYTSLIIQLLTQQESPQQICTQIGLCTAATPQLTALEPQASAESGTKCVLCKTVMEYAKNALNDPNNVKAIDQILKEACIIVPQSYRLLCDDVIDQYSPTIIAELDGDIDPQTFCTKLGLCTADAGNDSKQPSHSLKFLPMMDLEPAQRHLIN